MKSSTLKVVCWILLLFCNSVHAQTQTNVAKKETGSSISGKVTIKGKGAPGIIVALRTPDPYGRQTSIYKATTDQDGNYKITNVAPGAYQVMPAAPAFVSSGQPTVRRLIITESETVEGLDLALTRGGVITGRVTDFEGRPLIEEEIFLVVAENSNDPSSNTVRMVYTGASGIVQTDDRGIYRIFGIPQGKYKVALGQIENAGGPRRSQHRQTFYPDVTDSAKATIIEVSEGTEVTNVDLTAGRPFPSFIVTGRIVHGRTLQPLSNIRLGLQTISGGGGSFTNLASASNSQGEFKIENVTPGKYAVFVPGQPNSDVRSDAVSFEVIDQDVTGLLVKTSEGASLSGVLVFEGRSDTAAVALLSQLRLHTYVNNPGGEALGNWVQPVTINRDGSFKVSGLQSGLANFSLTGIDRLPPKDITLLRIERDGLLQPSGVELKDGEQVTGVRIVLSYGNGTIRGIVRVENGALPPNAQFGVWLTKVGDEAGGGHRTSHYPPVDSRGHFLFEGLTGGLYEVHAAIFTPGSRTAPPSTTQQVNVVEGGVSEVTLTVNLVPTPGPGNP